MSLSEIWLAAVVCEDIPLSIQNEEQKDVDLSMVFRYSGGMGRVFSKC